MPDGTTREAVVTVIGGLVVVFHQVIGEAAESAGLFHLFLLLGNK